MGGIREFLESRVRARARTRSLAWNPDNPIGTETLGGNTANQGSVLGNAAAYQGGSMLHRGRGRQARISRQRTTRR